jgi:conjugal transfer/entry exclusion protein
MSSKVAANIEEQIKKQQEKLTQLKAQKQAIEARVKASEAKKNRADDTRRRILIGAMVLDQWKTNPESEAKTKQALDKFLTKENDRKLFSLSQSSQG